MSLENEEVVERGTTEEGVAYVITEMGGYPNIIRKRYEGDNIPPKFQVKEKKTAKELKLK